MGLVGSDFLVAFEEYRSMKKNRWSLRWGSLEWTRETIPSDDKGSSSPWGAIAVFLALASLVLQALSMGS